MYVYALTEKTTGCYRIAQTNRKNIQYEELDPMNGCQRCCSCITDSGECIVGRDGGLFRFRGMEGVGCYAIPGHKQCIRNYKDCLLVCSFHDNTQLITIYNLQAHFIEFQTTLQRSLMMRPFTCREDHPEWVQESFSQWGDVFLFTHNHSIFCLHRLDLQTKLSVLYKQKLYALALTIAHSNDLYYNSIVEIHQMSLF